MLQNGSRFRGSPTDAEKAAWYILRNRQLDGNKFRRQCPIGKYVADFYCFETGLVIELDGSIHSQPSQLRKDAAKDAFFRKQGLHVLRVPNGLVLDYPEGFKKKVREALTQCLAAQTPSLSAYGPHTLTHRLAVPPLPAGEGLKFFSLSQRERGDRKAVGEGVCGG
jgi:very-short-patch-repair endonuclease